MIQHTPIAQTRQDEETCQLGDVPFVFLSYDEPWADWNWRDLKSKVPTAMRVHGVKGLDACHKAAAKAVEGQWLVTVDADTRLDPRLLKATVPTALMHDLFRFDWLSRNQVNGLWSGNGSVKLWPTRLLQEMQTHEAAPDEKVSMDHDIGGVLPGRSGQIIRPERGTYTDPARTALHGFRAGYREAVFLYQLAIEEVGRLSLDGWQQASVARILGVWCTLGRHAPNGHWVLYGARLGLLHHAQKQLQDPRCVNDYGWLSELWSHDVAPRYGLAGTDGPWRWDWLEDDLLKMGDCIRADLNFPIAEFDTVQSQWLVDADLLSATPAASRHDAIGYLTMMAAPDAHNAEVARPLFDVARTLDHPSAFHNTGLTYLRACQASASREMADWYFRAADALGNPHAFGKIEHLRADGVFEDKNRPARRACDYPTVPADKIKSLDIDGYCFVFDKAVQPTTEMEKHVPDPNLCTDGRVIGYSCYCQLTSQIIHSGIRFGAVRTFLDAPDQMPYAVLPKHLGERRQPKSRKEAALFAECDFNSGVLSDNAIVFASDGPYRDAYLGALETLLGNGKIQTWPKRDAEWLRFLKPRIARKQAFLEAADKLDEDTATALIRTADAVWGRLP
ncbi:hypothetical protein [uncultured Tateyamaria sp.]|uniref:hypothetical protein n=1 Tax=uncultured Tateyamaria sp. TaxID=455651 RepID=UPI00261EE686|nr:hypothetical protein [uncultured Tateyamaria sp.]